MTDGTQNGGNQSHVRHYSQDDIRRLNELVKEGCVVKQEVKDLNDGLNDTVKSVAEEMNIKPGILKKVIQIAHKQNLTEEREHFEEIEDILNTLNRG